MKLFRTVKTVLWSFIGIRKKSEYEEDLGKANPSDHRGGARPGALFVGGLIALVNWVV